MSEPSLTYYINTETGHLSSMVDNKDAIEQSVYKALDTERYAHIIYGWLYGLDMDMFIGQDFEYLQLNLQSYIEDCLLQDDRIESITNFTLTEQSTDSCLATFDVNTVEGVIQDVTTTINTGA
jgi:hypothetical protein